MRRTFEMGSIMAFAATAVSFASDMKINGLHVEAHMRSFGDNFETVAEMDYSFE